MKKRIACLLAGVPSGYKRCIPGLRQFLAQWSVDFFAVIRDEFATDAVLEDLSMAIPGVQVIVVPEEATESAVAKYAHPQLLPTVIKMWHEIWYGANAIPEKDQYDLMLRTRFDVFLSPQSLPKGSSFSPMSVKIPHQMSWSGCNDMLCLAPPSGFMEYARTLERMKRTSSEGLFIPEMLLARALSLAGVEVEAMEVNFILYREALLSGFSDAQLAVLAHTRPDLSTYKLGAPGDTESRRQERIATIEALTSNEARFPLLVPPATGMNFYPPESDDRDGTVFRWMGVHGKLQRAITVQTRQIRFVVNHHVQGWDLRHLRVLIDGVAVDLQTNDRDQHGRMIVVGRLHECPEGHLRRGIISFGSTFSLVPSASGENPGDHRVLSVAISDIEFAECGLIGAVAEAPEAASVL